jgi:hypothetical protein
MSQFQKHLFAVIGILAVVAIGAYWSLTHHKPSGAITSFDECAAAGNPVQESYPRRCTANGVTFTEDISTSTPDGSQPPVATSSANIRVSSPAPYQEVGLPLVIKGEAREFESAFSWRIRDEDGTVLVEGHGMADAPDVGQFGPFTVSSSYPQPKGTYGKVEVFAYSAKDGEQIDTVSIPVAFKNTETSAVKVFFARPTKTSSPLDCTTMSAFDRRVVKTSAIAQAALNELLQGPTNTEADKGAITSINQGTKLLSLRITNGTAYADFNNALTANVGGSCRVTAIRLQIENTLKQFPTVQNVVISVNGKTAGVLEP